MIYLVIYLIGFIITFGSLLLFEKRLEGDFLVLAIVAFTWPMTVPLKISFKIYYFITDISRELFKEPYEDPWEQSFTDYRDSQIAEIVHPNSVKSTKKSKPFKFGR